MDRGKRTYSGLLLIAIAPGCYQGIASDLVPDPDALSDGNPGGGNNDDGQDADADVSESGGVDTDPGLSCNVQDVLEAYACTTCHDSTPGVEGGGLDLISEGLADRLLNQPSLNASCSGDLLIDGEDPRASVFLRVLDPERYAGTGSLTCAPPVMPLGSTTRVSDDEIDCLEEWVMGLAEDDPGVPPAPFDPSSVESSVSKVKYLVHGGAVTDEELALARNEEGELDEHALRELIDGWVWSEPGQLTPEFDAKLQMFLDLALQQRDKTVSNTFKYQVQLDLKTDDAPLVDRDTFAETVGSMFVHTARDIVADERDFREVVTTRRWRVSTAILTALVHADTDLLNHRGRFDDVDKFGRYAHLQPEDYTDWRYVNLTQATAESPMEFSYENTPELAASLRAIGDEGSLALWSPRVGFFSTFVFFDQWRTNEDNDFRIVLSQTLIGALDLIFEAGDPTEPASLVGLVEEHSEEGTACYGCHQFMDPMRTVFPSYYEYQFRTLGPREGAASTFAFHGEVVETIESMDDLAQAMVGHPRFAQAWTQKVCMWANSQRCYEGDPEFQRVAETFRDGYAASADDDFRFDILMREFFSSTLVTGATPSVAHDHVEFMVSPTRQDHFCQATNARLRQAGEMRCQTEGLGDAEECFAGERNCLDQWKRAEAIGRDVYIRGSREFATPNTSDAMSAVAIREVCREISRSTVTASGPFPRDGNEEENMARLVETIMGLPPSHPRHDAAYEALLRGYRILRESAECPAGEDFLSANEGIDSGGDFVCGAGLNGSEAMQHIFVVACEDPESSGIGF